MAEKSYGFAIGNLRARENNLLSHADMIQLASIGGDTALANALRDKGFGDRLNSGNVLQLLDTHSRELWEYINEILPQSTVFAPFLMENDFHNLKAALKALIRNVDPDAYMLTPTLWSADTTKKALREKDFSLLDASLRSAAERAYEILTSSGDSQLSDAVIDSECMRCQLEAVAQKDYKCELGGEIIRETVFWSTVKAALRCAKAQKDAAFIEQSLVDTPFISLDSLKNAALGGVDKVLELLRSNGYGAAADAFESSPSDFERYCDNTVTAVARKAKRITLGPEPLIGYYIARKIEEKNVRIIYSAIKVGQPQEITMGRLRELYG